MPNTSFKKIFNYWKDKEITKDGKVIVGYGYGSDCVDDAIPVIVDWGEPQCWCCGKVIPAEDNPKYEKFLNSDKIDDIWELKEVKSRLERCHIIPNMLGGEDKPENLFLMCSKCHRDSPDTKYPKMFFHYIYKKRTNRENYISKALDIAKNDFNIIFPIVNKDTKSIFQENVGFHGGTISESSIIYAFLGHILENEHKRKENVSMLMEYLNKEIAKSEDLKSMGLYTEIDHERHETLLEIREVLKANNDAKLPVM